MATFKFVLWLFEWFEIQSTYDFEWDQGNNTKSIVKHGIVCGRAESFPFEKQILEKGKFMKKHYVKNEPGYERGVKFDTQAVLNAAQKSKRIRKVPTSVALEPELVQEMKEVAEAKGIPYQVMMRMFIIDGFKRFQQAS